MIAAVTLEHAFTALGMNRVEFQDGMSTEMPS
jgi:hypothetical protein